MQFLGHDLTSCTAALCTDAWFTSKIKMAEKYEMEMDCVQLRAVIVLVS